MNAPATGPGLVSGSVPACAPAAARQYRFTQNALDGGGMLQGRFTADDYNHDGVVRGFGLSFDGDSFVGSFALGMDDLHGLVWKTGAPWLDDEAVARGIVGIASDGPMGGVDCASELGPTGSIGGRVIDANGGHLSMTTQAIAVAAVPEPASAALLLAGIGVMSLMARRRPSDGSTQPVRALASKQCRTP